MGHKKASIHDIARQAGVSIATVSRVLNNSDSVRPRTAELVYQAAKDVGYPIASFRPSNPNKFLLIIIPNIDNPFYGQIIRGINNAASRHNFQYIIYQMEEVSLDSVMSILQSFHVLGIITLSPIHDVFLLEQINAVVPVMQCAEYIEDSNYPYVSVDDFVASRDLVKYLISSGRKRIALINGPSHYKYAKQRQLGYIAALEECGLAVDPSFIVSLPSIDFELAVTFVTQMLSAQNRPDAIFAVSDVCGVASIKVAQRLGLRVPEDISIAGFDNIYLAKMTEPALTSISQPQFRMGFLACEHLIELIENPGTPIRQTLLETELIIRDST